MTIVAPDDAGIESAIEALRAGRLIGLPTETVYGLAADLANDAAVRSVFEVKGRPLDHPLIVHIADVSQLVDLVDTSDIEIPGGLSRECRVLVTECWPGPLTVIVRAAPTVSRVATGGHDTVAVRLPAHPVAQRIIRGLGRPVVAPSANRFGSVSPTTARHVVDDLDGGVAVVVDGGACDIGVESTIVDCTGDRLEILRPGAISREDIEAVLSANLDTRDDGTRDDGTVSMVSDVPTGPSRAPGMLARHYSPRARLVLHEHRSLVPRHAEFVLDYSADVVAAARSLYGDLRRCDARGAPEVHVVLPPAVGLGYAVRDRLHKAAAPR